MCKFFKVIFFSLFVTLLAACGTPYQKASVWSPLGYSEVMLDSRRAQISFSSTRGDKDEAVVRGALLRAAELAKDNGYDGFVVTSDAKGGSTTSMQTPGTFYGQTIGGQTFGTVYGGIPIIIQKAQQVISVHFYHRHEAPPSAFDADDVIKRNRPFFQK